MSKLLTVDDVADKLQLASSTVYEYARRGIIPSVKIGTSVRFRETDIEKWIDSKVEGPVAVGN